YDPRQSTSRTPQSAPVNARRDEQSSTRLWTKVDLEQFDGTCHRRSEPPRYRVSRSTIVLVCKARNFFIRIFPIASKYVTYRGHLSPTSSAESINHSVWI